MRLAWTYPFILLLTLAGCSSTQGPADPAAPATYLPTESDPTSLASVPVPDDFSVDITILAAQEGARAEARNSRYVLFPDGTLRYASSIGKGPNTLPPIIRRLNRRQVDGLWNRARQLGLTTPSKADEVSNFRKVWSPWEGSVYLFAFTADGSYWNFTRKVDPGQELDPALRSFLRSIAALAWAKDEADIQFAIDPKRFDYGPDPYAQYRRNFEALEAAEVEKADEE